MRSWWVLLALCFHCPSAGFQVSEPTDGSRPPQVAVDGVSAPFRDIFHGTSSAVKLVGDSISSAIEYVRHGDFMLCAGRSLLWIGVGALGGLVAVPIFFITIAMLGFGAGGIVAGSCAAVCQAGIGNVAAGSCFSMATQAGMIGCRAAVTVPLLVASSVVGVIVSIGLLAWTGGFSCLLAPETSTAQ